MTEIKTVPLLQAHKEGDVFELAKATYNNDIPGFQDTRMSSLPFAMHTGHLFGVMDEIEAASQAVTGARVPFTNVPGVDGYNAGKYAPHIDGGLRGLAIHENKGDGGDVFLAHPLVNPNQGQREVSYLLPGETTRDYQGIGMAGLLDAIKYARVHMGRLTRSGLTVFSEGNLDYTTPDGVEQSLNPAIHHFHRNQPGEWARYSSALKDQALSVPDLAHKREQARGTLARLGAERLKSEKRAQVFNDPKSDDIKVEDILEHPGMYSRPDKPGNQRMGWRDRRFARKQLKDGIETMKREGEEFRRRTA